MTRGENISLKNPLADDGPQPLFIFGISPRSGTHFLRDLLCLHPDCEGYPVEEDFFILGSRKLKDYADEVVSMSASIHRSNMPFEVDVYRAQIMASMGDGLIRLIRTQAPGKRVVLKTPTPVHIEQFPALFPNAPLILIVRDVRDVIVSGMKTFKHSFEHMLKLWNFGAEAILDYRRDESRWKKMILVRYEDLVSSPEQEIKKILDHCGLDPKTYPLQNMSSVKIRGSSEFADEGLWKTKPKPKDFNPVGRWKDLPRRQLTKVYREAGPSMKELGYDF